MMITKQDNGSYRIRKGYNGKMYSVTVKYKPTQKEAEALIDEKIKSKGAMKVNKDSITFDETAADYIELKRSVLSPSTIVGYEKVKRNIPKWFADMKLCDIENYHIQKCINEYMVGRARKTVANMLGFITPVVKMYKKIDIDVTLPQKVEKEDYIPTDEDIKKILEYSKDTRYYIALILATFGLRRSEICALSLDDLNGSILTINKAIVKDNNKEWVIKTTKTPESIRKVPLPDEVADIIREKGMYNDCPDSINEYLQSVIKILEIPHFTLHKFRHYFATKMSQVLPEADVLRLGGWKKSSQVMKVIYRHSTYERDKAMQDKAVNAMRHLF